MRSACEEFKHLELNKTGVTAESQDKNQGK